MKASFYYPAQPYVITQAWGVYAPELYEKFGYSRHNGQDCAHGYNSRLRAPFDYSFYRNLWQPNGGGNVLSIISKEQYDSPDGKPAYVCLDFMHLAKVLKTSGEGMTGDLVAIAGNTGFSTGPHTHLQFRWVRRKNNRWVDVEKNDANNSFDPQPFWNGLFAVDYKKPPEPVLVPQVVHDTVEGVNEALEGIQEVPEASRPYLFELLKEILNALTKLLTKG